MEKPDEYQMFAAQHILSQLNKIGVVKDAQVNTTTITFVARELQEYMTAQKLKFEKV